MLESLKTEFLTMGSLPWEIFTVRIFGAILLCGMIGFERESRNRPAGLRTHMLVGLASAIYCILMLELLDRGGDYSDPVRIDPLRVIEAVTSGVAFLAAGMIVFSGGKVRGLTTGASLWLAASVGLACGLGLWGVATMTTIPALAIIRLIKVAEDKVHDEKQAPN